MIDKAEVKKDVTWIGARLREPSTYLGLGALLAAFHLADAASWVSAVTSIGLGVGGIIGILLPEGKAAPVKPAATNPTTSALAMGIIVLALAVSPALAQTKGAPKNTPSAAPADERFPAAPAGLRTGPGTILPCDPANLLPGCRNADGTISQAAGAQGNPLANLTDDVLAKLLADFTYAAARADATRNTVTAPCWHAWVTLLTAQQAPLKDAAGNPLTRPEPHLVVDAELASELINQLQPNSDLSIACAPTLQASQRNISTLVGAVLSGGALGLFKLP
jgi:hypothetical protein